MVDFRIGDVVGEESHSLQVQHFRKKKQVQGEKELQMRPMNEEIG